VATFIENDYGTQTARALIYKAKWFEFFLAYFIAILTYQIIKYKTYKTKFPVFLFHFAFIIIALGALITRYVGYEGIMHIREGQTTNKMVSDVKVMEVFAKSKEGNASLEKPLYFSTMTHNSMEERLKVGNKEVKISLETYLPTAEEEIVPDPKGDTLLEMKVSAGGKGEIHYFKKGTIKDFGQFYIAYGVENIPTDRPTFKINGEPGALQVDFPFIIKTLNMDTRTPAEIQPKPEYIKLKVSVGDKSKEVVFKPYKGETGPLKQFSLNGVDIQMRIGSKIITLPFSIKLNDFELERYPGSMTPASYSSRVVLIDNHRNFRFFQSSYDPDEHGTVLSVNHDPGTLPTYIGYILLALGMLWSLFIPNGRFQTLLKGARKLQDGALVAAFTIVVGDYRTQHPL